MELRLLYFLPNKLATLRKKCYNCFKEHPIYINSMKKFICLILTLIFSIATLFIGCNSPATIRIYAPDGAPALALSSVIKQDFENAEICIVSADKIGSLVSGKEKKADICILPINMASKLIGNGEDYKTLGTVTHGNFYFLSRSETVIDRENIDRLIGKTVGVMQLQNVPGLTLQSVFINNAIEYTTIQDISEKEQNKVNLMAINKIETARTDIDAFLIPSPQADAIAQTTDLKFVGSLGELYGDFGFPQAIIVVKNQVLEKNLPLVKEFVKQLESVENYLKEENKAEICTLLRSKIESGLTPVFNENNLTSDSINRSKIKFIACKNSKETMKTFIQKLKSVNPNSVGEFSEDFFYLGE